MSHFSSEAVKIAVAELLRMHGADKTSVAAHQVFVDITERYMRLLAKTAQNYAEHSGRTQVNIFDVIDCFRLLNIQVSPMEDYLKSITAQKHKMLEKVKGLAAKNNIDVDEELVVPFAFPRLEPCSYPIHPELLIELTQSQTLQATDRNALTVDDSSNAMDVDVNQEQAFEVKPELLDPIFAPIPTIAETEFALNEEQDDAVPTWEDDLYAVLADDSDDDDFADNPYYVTQKIEDARLDKCHFNIVQFTAEQQVPKGPTVMTKTDLSDSFEELVQSLGESETKRQALTHENLIEIIVQRPTWGVAVPTVTRAANSDIGSILTDMFVVTLPSLHGYFGVDQLPEKNMASTDVMMGIAPEIKPHKEPKEPKEPKQKTPHPLRKSVTAEKLGKNLPIQAIVTSVVTEVASEIVEVINCICATPAIDDGLFMISCDKCTTWFHGHCVGITASVSEWTCTRHGSPSAPPT